jgi:acyl carrier protein
MSTTVGTVLAVVRDIAGPGRPLDITDQSRLFEHRLIDSFGLIRLVAALEAAFALRLPTDALTTENFATPAAIAELIDRHQRLGS